METMQEFMNHVREEVKKIESCDFEEFKSNMIVITEDLFKAVLMIFEQTLKGRQELLELATEQITVIADPAFGVQPMLLAYTEADPSYQVMLSPAAAVIVTCPDVVVAAGPYTIV